MPSNRQDKDAQKTTQKLLHNKSHSVPKTTPSSSTQHASVMGANPTLFNNKKRGDSPDSNIEGGSSEWDPFRDAVQKFARENPGVNGPPSTEFGRMADQYHKANSAAKQLKNEIKALPQAEKDKLKPDLAALLKQESDGRKEMGSNWPGYDDWKTAKGHTARITIVDGEIRKLERQIKNLRTKVDQSKKNKK